MLVGQGEGPYDLREPLGFRSDPSVEKKKKPLGFPKDGQKERLQPMTGLLNQIWAGGRWPRLQLVLPKAA